MRTKWSEEKHVQVGRPINNIVQVDLPMYLSSGSCHSAQQLVGSSLSYYLHNYVYLYTKWAASFRSAMSCTTYTTPYIIHTNTSKSEKWILVASSTVYVRLARLGSSRSMWGGEHGWNPGQLHLYGIPAWLCDWYQAKPKRTCLFIFLDIRRCHLTIHHACVFAVWIIIIILRVWIN